jgi:hypothetical protein
VSLSVPDLLANISLAPYVLVWRTRSKNGAEPRHLYLAKPTACCRRQLWASAHTRNEARSCEFCRVQPGAVGIAEG